VEEAPGMRSFPFVEDMVREAFGVQIPLPIPTFGLLVAASVMTGGWVFQKELERREAAGLYPKNSKKLSSLITEFMFSVTVAGMIGARVFHILEMPEEFVRDPWGMIFSRGGFSILGGLFFGTLTGVWFVRRMKLPILLTADAAAPALMLGYAIGRIGCQLSGDGDWGQPANMALKPDWLPTWFWAQTYDGNIIQEPIAPPGVYPTPMYESLAAFLIFAILWRFRRHNYASGWLFALYLGLSGVERFLVERIRINPKYHLFGMAFTQAEMLSVMMMIAGLVGLIYFSRSRRAVTAS
jgi:phosphatidylglycerol:prolipoprotein diacylglycerol transferase